MNLTFLHTVYTKSATDSCFIFTERKKEPFGFEYINKLYFIQQFYAKYPYLRLSNALFIKIKEN